jgi:hypothetical protein
MAGEFLLRWQGAGVIETVGRETLSCGKQKLEEEVEEEVEEEEELMRKLPARSKNVASCNSLAPWPCQYFKPKSGHINTIENK